MDFLVLAPPVCTPAEPPSGAFLLASSLAGRGFDVGLLDLSLELFHRLLGDPRLPGPEVAPSVSYLVDTEGGYDPPGHRTAVGILHKKLKGVAALHPGWRVTLMDVGFPGRVHDPEAIAAMIGREGSPFTELFEAVLGPALEELAPRRVLISLAYLSQLPAAIELAGFLEARGHRPVVGGSLINSLASTGHGLDSLSRVFTSMEVGDGAVLLGEGAAGSMLDRLAWPRVVSEKPYLSSRPVVPLTLSVGCFWRRCLFCPDRELDRHNVPRRALAEFLESMPRAVASRRPIVHLLDSAIPPRRLERFLPLAKEHGLRFYGFARPTANLTDGGLLERAAGSGLGMLQLGGESGSGRLLERYDKGFMPDETERVIRRAAEAGVRTYLYLLLGLPGEGEEDRAATLDFVARLSPEIDFLNTSLFNLPRYCELAERAEEFGIEIGDFPEDGAIRLYWPFTCGGTSPRDEARRFLLGSFADHPGVRPITLQTPRWLRAAHMALMKVEGRSGP